MPRFRTNDMYEVVTSLYRREGLRIDRVQRFDAVALFAENNQWRNWTFRVALSGTRTIGYNGRRHTFAPNTVCWHSPLSEPVQMRWLPGTSSDHVVITLTARLWATFLNGQPTFAERNNANLRGPVLALQPAVPALLHTIRRMFALAQINDGNHPAMDNQVRLLLDLFGGLHFGAQPGRNDDEQRQRVEKTIAAMSQHIGKTFSVAQAAAKLNVSERQLQRDFLTYAGMTPMRYWNLLRLSEANFLLAETTLPVAEIAAMLGYVSPTHFSSAFRQMYQCSPRQVRTPLAASDQAGD